MASSIAKLMNWACPAQPIGLLFWSSTMYLLWSDPALRLFPECRMQWASSHGMRPDFGHKINPTASRQGLKPVSHLFCRIIRDTGYPEVDFSKALSKCTFLMYLNPLLLAALKTCYVFYILSIEIRFWKAVNHSHFTAHLLPWLDWICSPLGGGLSEPEGKEGWAQYIPCSTSCHQTYSSSLQGTMNPYPFTLCTLMRRSDIFHDRWWGCASSLRGRFRLVGLVLFFFFVTSNEGCQSRCVSLLYFQEQNEIKSLGWQLQWTLTACCIPGLRGKVILWLLK